MHWNLFRFLISGNVKGRHQLHGTDGAEKEKNQMSPFALKIEDLLPKALVGLPVLQWQLKAVRQRDSP